MRRWEGGRGAGWGGGSNNSLTFEPETNESIVIKLFICLFTMKNGVKEEEGEVERGRHHEGEEKGRRPQQRAMMSSCKERRLQQLLSHNFHQLSHMCLNGNKS